MIADGKERFRELGRTGSADHRGERNKKSRMGAREREREVSRHGLLEDHRCLNRRSSSPHSAQRTGLRVPPLSLPSLGLRLFLTS